MLLGKVVGSVWGTQVTEGITARKLLIVEPVAGVYPTLESGHVIATDNLGAGTGDHVIVCFGSPSRNSYDEERTPLSKRQSSALSTVPAPLKTTHHWILRYSSEFPLKQFQSTSTVSN